MDEEDIETAKSEFRVSILHSSYIHMDEEGEVQLGCVLAWATAVTITEPRHYCITMSASLCP